MTPGRGLWIIAAAWSWSSAASAQESTLPRVDFKRDIHPILNARCFKCHTGSNSKSGVRLDYRLEILGESNGRPLAIAGRSGESRLIHRILSADRKSTRLNSSHVSESR